jgi:hypothetical protein
MALAFIVSVIGSALKIRVIAAPSPAAVALKVKVADA